MENKEMLIAQAFEEAYRINKCDCIKKFYYYGGEVDPTPEKILYHANRISSGHKCIGSPRQSKVPRNYLISKSSEDLKPDSDKFKSDSGLSGYAVVPIEIWNEIQPVNRVFAMTAYDESKIQINEL